MRPFLMSLAGIVAVGLSGAVLSRGLAEAPAPAAAGADTDWPQWRGPSRQGAWNGAWSHDWPAEGPKVLWRANVGAGCSGIVVRDGRLYTMGNSGSADLDKEGKSQDVIYCFDAAGGQERWRYAYDAPYLVLSDAGGPNATPACDGPRLYTISKLSHAHCLDAAKGEVLWQRKLVTEEKPVKSMTIWGGVASSPLIVGDIAIFSAVATAGLDVRTGATKYEINPKGGTTRWVSPQPATLEGQRVVVVPGKEGLVFFDPADGTEKGVRGPIRTYTADPVFFDGKVFVSTRVNEGGARVYDLAASAEGKAQPLWAGKDGAYWGNAVIAGGLVFSGHEKGLECIDLASGEVKWVDKRFPNSQPVLAGGKLLVMGSDGKLRVMAAESECKVLAEAAVLPVAKASRFTLAVTLAQGRIYCKNTAGDIVCLDASGR